MKDVKELTEKFVQEEKELVNVFVGLMDSKAIAEADVEEFMIMKNAFKLMNTANELMVEYARIIDEMNTKLDRIVESKKAGS